MNELGAIKKIAAKRAGVRELYAMQHGTASVIAIGGKRYLKYTYSKDDIFQDANGAMFDMNDGKWVD